MVISRTSGEDRLKRSVNDTSDMSRTVIGAVSPIVAWEIGKDVPPSLWGIVSRMRNGSSNILLFQTVLEVDWVERCNGKLVLNTGAYLYYAYETGRVTGYPSWTHIGTEVYSVAEPKFLSEQRTKIADCEVEVHHYNVDSCQGQRDDREAQLRWHIAEERRTTLSTLWRNVFTACVMNVTLSSGEVADLPITALRGRHAANDEIRTLPAQNVELCATENRVRGQLSQLCAATTQTSNEAEGL